MTITQTIKELNKRTDAIIKNILAGNSMSYDAVLYKLNYEFLSDGIKGVGVETAASIKTNLSQLSEKKVKKMFDEINAFDKVALMADKGKGIKSRYNDEWLKTEKNMTKRKVREVKEWNNYTNIGGLVEWITSNDERVRESHRKLDGLRLPPSHPFWKTHTPGAYYGCRCTTKLITKEAKESKNIPNITPDQPGNTFYDGKIFDVDKLYN